MSKAGRSVSGRVTTTAVTVEDAGKDVDPSREPRVPRPARYFVHWKTEPAIGKWLETSAKLSATRMAERNDRPTPDEDAADGR